MLWVNTKRTYINRFKTNYIVLLSILGISSFKRDEVDSTNYGYYLCVAITYLVGTVTANWALQWVTYPMQVTLKSVRPIPVMILNFFIGKKVCTIQRYIFVIIITAGVTLFALRNNQSSSNDQDKLIWGQILLFISLFSDGLTGAVQERIRHTTSPSAIQMMIAINAWGSIIMFILVIASGQLIHFISFATIYPYVLWWLLAQAVTGAIGHLFILLMVVSFGSLPCSFVTTTRKFFTIFFSVVFFQNALTNQQWIGTIFIFGGLLADAVFGARK